MEDHFGIVQKDLRICLSSLARLSIAIDAYVKTIAVSPNFWVHFQLNLFWIFKRTDKIALYHDLKLHILDGELANALKEIRTVFGPYIK